MIKISSTLFVTFVVLLFIFAVVITLIPSLMILNRIINILAIGLLLVGVVLIVSLIVDRFKESKNEGDSYKKY